MEFRNNSIINEDINTLIVDDDESFGGDDDKMLDPPNTSMDMFDEFELIDT